MNAPVRPSHVLATLSRWRGWPWRWLLSLLSLGVLGMALFWLQRELRQLHPNDLRHAFAALSPLACLAALGATAVSYAALAVGEALALRLVGRPLPWRHVGATAFLATAVGHNLGFAMLSTGAVRLRLYGAWGLSAAEVAAVTGLASLRVGLGVLLGGGAALLLAPTMGAQHVGLANWLAQSLGALLLALPLAALLWLRQAPRRGEQPWWPFPWPTLSQGALQIGLALVDLAAAALALWCLLPAGSVGFTAFLGLYLLALLAGVLSHVPGGLGVFEAVLIAGLPSQSTHELLAALLVYRAIYYLLPLALAVLVASVMLGRAHAQRWWRWTRRAQPAVSWVAPWLGSAMVFAAGCTLLISGSLPALRPRLHGLHGLVPLPAIELSHLAGSLIGLLLLVLSQALLRRVAAARRLAVWLLLAGALASLLKGLDLEEAALALLTVAVLQAGRAAFHRPVRLQLTDLGPQAWLAIGVVVLASIWVGLFSFRHVEYANDLWWRFALREDAPRYLRASLLVALACLVLALWQLVRPRAPAAVRPSRSEREHAARLVAESARSDAALALLDDKRLLCDPGGLAFLMYQVQGGSWIAMGDPVGAPAEGDRLAWQLLEQADRHGARAVFYQVDAHRLPLYLDMGMAATKLGEEALVPLAGFTLDGPERAALRRAWRKAEREGLRHEVITPAEVAASVDALRAVSDAWLSTRNTREKGFSLGRFNAAYLSHFPCVRVWHGESLVAFANLWCGDGHSELSIDLMRYTPLAPPGVMDYLLIETMRWGATQGYERFNLGMAPLAGLQTHPLAPLSQRLGGALFRHGEHFYRFQGLRDYKAKFDPVWQPRYLAAPGGLGLLGALIDLSVLIGGGWRGVVAR